MEKRYAVLLFFIFLVSFMTYKEQWAAGAKINAPFFTKFEKDVSGRDVFKISVGLINVRSDVGITEVCVISSAAHQSEICHLLDPKREFSENRLYNINCTSCILTFGFFVFPSSDVPIGTNVTACARELNSNLLSCNYTFNSPEAKSENVTVKLE
jgi:hypothetical protein